jgi:nitrous oxide reductase accessory protein NosL
VISCTRNMFAPQARTIGINVVLIAILAFPALLRSETVPVPQGTKCAECGMTVDQSSKFMTQVITVDGKDAFFCDIGDMLVHFKTTSRKMKVVRVRDHASGAWIDGKKAFYVWNNDLKTPMSWGIAAFAEETAARKWGIPADFNRAFKLLR